MGHASKRIIYIYIYLDVWPIEEPLTKWTFNTLKSWFSRKMFDIRRPGKALFKGSEFKNLSVGIGLSIFSLLSGEKKGMPFPWGWGGGGNMGTPGSSATPLLHLIVLNLGDIIVWKEAVILSFTDNFVA